MKRGGQIEMERKNFGAALVLIGYSAYQTVLSNLLVYTGFCSLLSSAFLEGYDLFVANLEQLDYRQMYVSPSIFFALVE